jgi:hypothetical protein
VALPVKALKAGQESYWLDQIARNREEYFSGRGESPGRFLGNAAAAATSEGVASAEQVQGDVPGPGPGHRGAALRAAAARRPAVQAGRRAAAGRAQGPGRRTAQAEVDATRSALDAVPPGPVRTALAQVADQVLDRQV